MGWGRWGFPLPDSDSTPQKRGLRLGSAAAQRLWQQSADVSRISQVTLPNNVLAFISKQPGLADVCHEHPSYLISYAPQLSIPGFGGEFEDDIDAIYHASVKEEKARQRMDSRSGTALTVDGSGPQCDELVALHSPTFGRYEASYIACSFVQGDLMGPPVRVYDNIDYVAWLLSRDSLWLPAQIRSLLLKGMRDWAVWIWQDREPIANRFGFVTNDDTGILAGDLIRHRSATSFRMTKRHERDITSRLQFSHQLLGLPEDGQGLMAAFLDAGFIEGFFESLSRRKSAKSIAPPP
jgi:hypothetical protein